MTTQGVFCDPHLSSLHGTCCAVSSHRGSRNGDSLVGVRGEGLSQEGISQRTCWPRGSQELKIYRENAVEKRREFCTNAGICLWVFLLAARPLLSRSGVRAFRHGHLQPPQPRPRTPAHFPPFPGRWLILLHCASSGPAPAPPPCVPAGVRAVCSPRSRRSVILPPHQSCVCCQPLSRSAQAFLKYLPFTLSASDSLSAYEAVLWQPPLTFFSLTQQSTYRIDSVSSIMCLFSFCPLVL